VKEAILNRRPIKALAALDRNMMLGDAKHRELLSLFLQVRDWGSYTRHRIKRSGFADDDDDAGAATETLDMVSLFKVALS
jgi:hypothetical protein